MLRACSLGQTYPEPKALIKLLFLCTLAVVANLLSIFFKTILEAPLFLDTIFTVAVTFALGLFPGIAVAVLTWVLYGISSGPFHPFVFVAIAEVLLVSLLKPPFFEALSWTQNPALPERKTTYIVIVTSQLFVLYVVCAVVVSVFGGALAFLYYTVWNRDTPSFLIAVNAFRWNFLQGGSPVFLADILSRIQTNMVSRFIVIFGGYFVSLGIRRMFRK